MCVRGIRLYSGVLWQVVFGLFVGSVSMSHVVFVVTLMEMVNLFWEWSLRVVHAHSKLLAPKRGVYGFLSASNRDYIS